MFYFSYLCFHFYLLALKVYQSVPSPPPAASILTPDGTMILGITTPEGSGATEQSKASDYTILN
jgi:hypothetical protein